MPSLSSDDLDFLTQVATEQIALVQALRDALEAGDDRRALAVARIITRVTVEDPLTAANQGRSETPSSAA